VCRVKEFTVCIGVNSSRCMNISVLTEGRIPHTPRRTEASAAGNSEHV
jgi:hypothetical protein